ncbi:MAG: hypothetical protein ACYDHX_16460 [Methanothrix sp.]
MEPDKLSAGNARLDRLASRRQGARARAWGHRWRGGVRGHASGWGWATLPGMGFSSYD